MGSTARRRGLRIAVWVGALALAATAGFVYGALTYVPPAPELEGMPSEAFVPDTPPPSTAPSSDASVLPDLVGKHRNAAETTMAKLGVLWVIDPVKGPDDDVVIRQHPPAGEPIRPMTSVLLSVRCDPRPCPQPPEGRDLYDPCACLWR